MAASRQPCLWQGRSFCFAWSRGQLGIIPPARPSLPHTMQQHAQFPAVCHREVPGVPLPFQMCSRAELRIWGRGGTGARSGMGSPWCWEVQALSALIGTTGSIFGDAGMTGTHCPWEQLRLMMLLMLPITHHLASCPLLENACRSAGSSCCYFYAVC